ncbi:MAG: hypothetical protein L0Y58_12575 [Verrucomicrobia subdivision 3 bacterium]|nr:hypothetical protein [Limisphaerales bacterium]
MTTTSFERMDRKPRRDLSTEGWGYSEWTEFDLPTEAAASAQSYEELVSGLDFILDAPKWCGMVEMIVARPASEDRECLDKAVFSPIGGLHGDRWEIDCSRKLPDGSSDPGWQITLINSRCIQLISGRRDRWPLAGDNLVVDLDLSQQNLPVDSRLRVGSAVLQILPTPHLGCAKFSRRFGPDALAFVNSPQGRKLRLRGVYARVVEPGIARPGSSVEKVGARESHPNPWR